MSKSDGVTLDASWIKALDALPDVRIGNPGFRWTPERDELLRRGWGKKRQPDLCKLIGCSTNVARRRARELGVAS